MYLCDIIFFLGVQNRVRLVALDICQIINEKCEYLRYRLLLMLQPLYYLSLEVIMEMDATKRHRE
jgi:hypothetical protein